MGEGCRSRKDQLCSDLLITAAPIVGNLLVVPEVSTLYVPLSLLSLQSDGELFSSIPSPTYSTISRGRRAIPFKGSEYQEYSRTDFLERHPRSIAIHFSLHISLRPCYRKLVALGGGRRSCRLCASPVCP